MSAGRVAALLVALAALLGPAPPLLAQSAEEREQELESVRRAIEERRERVIAFERRERGLLETVEGVDRAAARFAAELATARRSAREARRELAGLEERAEELVERRRRTRRAMAVRAVALYKAGEAGPVSVLFSARSLQDVLQRTRALQILLQHDHRLLERFRTDGAALERTREELFAAARRHDAAARVARARARQLRRELQAKRELLVAVRSDRTRERAALVELEAAAVALEETLAGLRDVAPGAPASPAGPAFASLRGRLEAPVDAPVERSFGRVVDAQFRTETFRKGIDFAAAPGTAVRSIAAGEVRFAGWFRGYGRLVILDHGGDYFSVSGHLDEVRVEVGSAVPAGEVIGTVGETGSLSGPRLYFEIRRGAEPLDPQQWLRPLIGLN